MATVLFVSYRRTDSRSATGRLCDHLRSHGWDDAGVGKKMFIDIDDIPPGADFRAVVHDALRRCDLVLVVIGPGWLDAIGNDEQRRLDDPSDSHRLEVAAALASDALVIPVLVDGASVPRTTDLPPDLQALSYRNAWELTERRFADDVADLARHIDLAVVGAPGAGNATDLDTSHGSGDLPGLAPQTPRQRGPRRWRQLSRPGRPLALGGLAVGVAVLVVATLVITNDGAGDADLPTPEERQEAIIQLAESLSSDGVTSDEVECLLRSAIDEFGWSATQLSLLSDVEDDPIVAVWGDCVESG